MAKVPVKKEIKYSRIRPLVRAMLDPYNSVRVRPDEENGIIMDANKAKFHVDMGEAEYIEEECPSPFAPKPAPAPAVEKPVIAEKMKI